MEYHYLTEKIVKLSPALSGSPLLKKEADKIIRKWLRETAYLIADTFTYSPERRSRLFHILGVSSEKTLEEKFKEYVVAPENVDQQWNVKKLVQIAEEHYKKT